MQNSTTNSTKTSSTTTDIPFPLDPHADPAICRDVFLQKILAPYEKSVQQKLSELSTRMTTKSISREQNLTAEGLLLKQMVDRDATIVADLGMSALEKQSERKMEFMAQKYLEFTVELQKSAIEYAIQQTIRQLKLKSDAVPGDPSELPNHFFAWSIEFFLKRLNISQLYLDLLEFELDAMQLNSLKFKVDLLEIVTLLYSIQLDVRNDKSICGNSIELIKFCNYDENSDYFNEITELVEQKSTLFRQLLHNRGPSLMRELQERNSKGNTEAINEDVKGPIEFRFHQNWNYSILDQKLFEWNCQRQLMQDELNSIKKLQQQDGLVNIYASNIYNIEIEKLKVLINEWTLKYETDLEIKEAECSSTASMLQKIKDDMKFFREQIVMFRTKIAMVRELIAIEQQKEREILERRLLASHAKAENKSKKNKKEKKRRTTAPTE